MTAQHALANGAAQLRLGISGWPFRSTGLVETIALLKQVDVHLLDFWPELQGSMSDAEVVEVTQQQGVSLYCYNIPDHPRLGSPAPADLVQRGLRRGISRARCLGIKHVQFYGALSPGEPLSEAVRRSAGVLKPIVEMAEEADLTLWFENDYDDKGLDREESAINRTPEAMSLLLQEVGSSRLQVTFDACNFSIAGVEAYPHAYEMLRPHIANVHVKDARRVTPEIETMLSGALLTEDIINGRFLPVPAGQGAVNHDGVLRRLVDDGYKGFVTLDALCHASHFDKFFPNDSRYVRARVPGPR